MIAMQGSGDVSRTRRRPRVCGAPPRADETSQQSSMLFEQENFFGYIVHETVDGNGVLRGNPTFGLRRISQGRKFPVPGYRYRSSMSAEDKDVSMSPVI